jgi:hypothetical protein
MFAPVLIKGYYTHVQVNWGNQELGISDQGSGIRDEEIGIRD